MRDSRSAGNRRGLSTKNLLTRVVPLVLVTGAALVPWSDARSDATPVAPGVAAVYGQIPADQVEFLSTEARIQSVAVSGAPMAIWETLEHGEKVECIECIPSVEPLLYDANTRTREIAAWWLRRRVFGVFGDGEVYSRVVLTLRQDPSAKKRAYAAAALGEFLIGPGIDACATSLRSDPDPTVRAAAALALGRLNDDGAGALVDGWKDSDPTVRAAAVKAAGRLTTFTDVPTATTTLASLTGDADPLVRRHAVLLLDQLHAATAVAPVMALAKSDPDEDVRISACHALGAFGDSSASPTLHDIADTDTSGLVRDQALIALRRL